MAVCPVCNIKFDNNDFLSLSEHFIDMADSSEPLHVMWLNRNITKTRVDKNRLTILFKDLYHLKINTLESH